MERGKWVGGFFIPERTTPLEPDAPKRSALAEAIAKAKAEIAEGKRVAATNAERQSKHRAKKKEDALKYVAILDMETDPFDNTSELAIRPFLAVLYSDEFEPIVIWEEDYDAFVNSVVNAIEKLPNAYTIYAHNGGKFDFMFLLSRIRGAISFKGRGIMSAQIGKHELRDSFHIIPERLASYNKDAFDYANMAKGKRDAYRKEIIDYCIADCRYLLELVKGFIEEFGFKISIGQAALSELRKHYKFKRVNATMDAQLRKFFFGGRVECLQGRVLVQGHYKLYDVNSMYPYAMTAFLHPIGDNYVWRPGEPGEYTCFIELSCKNDGALVQRRFNPDTGNEETTTQVREGRFHTTIHEYRVALKYGLISDVEIHWCVDCAERTTFEKFIVPIYNRRMGTKHSLKEFKLRGDTSSFAYFDMKKNDMFLKFLLNNSWGKMAQNPRRYKETYITEPGEVPPEDFEGRGNFPVFQNDQYSIWERPAPSQRYNNVGTGASVTGAARSVLMEAIQNADDPIYCDTDSLICRELRNVDFDGERLGAWDLEDEFREVVVNGKKMYSCLPLVGDKAKVRSKGVAGLTHEEMRSMFLGDVLEKVAFGPTLKKTGEQSYNRRRVQATAPRIGGNAHDTRSIRNPLRGNA